MDGVCIHWTRPRFDDDDVTEDDKLNISIIIECKVIKERFMKADNIMKLHIKEQFRKIAYLLFNK